MSTLELWQQKVEHSAKGTKLKTRRQKLAHYRRVKGMPLPFGTVDRRSVEQITREWEARQIERAFKRKCYEIHGSPANRLEQIKPPDDYLIRLAHRNGRKFSKCPEVQSALAANTSFETVDCYRGYRLGWYKRGVAFVDAFQATLRDGRVVIHFNGEFANNWESHPLARKPIKRKRAGKIDLLSAIFAVTRAAKRYRDAAQACYRARAYNFATVHKEKKAHLYGLKERGIAAAFAAGRIAFTVQRGCFAEYRGEGYCFHSLLRPVNVLPDACIHSLQRPVNVVPGTEPQRPDSEAERELFVEAKPKEAKEARLCDAEATLQVLPEPGIEFTRLTPPNWPDRRTRRDNEAAEFDGRRWVTTEPENEEDEDEDDYD